MVASNTKCRHNSSVSQVAFLNSMKGGYTSWPTLTSQEMATVSEVIQALPHDVGVAVMTYAGDIASWYIGDLTSDVYYCPERHGTYYGGFYLKDAPAVGVANYQISTSVTADIGMALCYPDKGYVSAQQATYISNLVTDQKTNLNTITNLRTQIATALRTLLDASTNTNTVKASVLSLSETYGDLDGINNYNYMCAFKSLYFLLSTTQMTKLLALRDQLLKGTYSNGSAFDFTNCQISYTYSDPVTSVLEVEEYLVTDTLFV